MKTFLATCVAVLSVAALALLVAELSAPQPEDHPVLVGRAEIVDGDTIEVAGERVRLHGVDAPEISQPCANAAGLPYPCGEVAARYLAELTADREVACIPAKRDRYGRWLAVCYIGGDLDAAMSLVRAGCRRSPTRYSDRYEPEEHEAKLAHRGMWAGSFEQPESFRHWRRAE